MGRNARGVRAIKLREGDFTVGMCVCREGADILTVSENGMGKRCSTDEYREQTRGGQGTTNYSITEKTGRVAAVLNITDDNDIIAIASDGKTIRMHVAEIRRTSRRTKGVIIMRPEEGSVVLSAAAVEHREETAEAVEVSAETAPVEGGLAPES